MEEVLEALREVIDSEIVGSLSPSQLDWVSADLREMVDGLL